MSTIPSSTLARTTGSALICNLSKIKAPFLLFLIICMNKYLLSAYVAKKAGVAANVVLPTTWIQNLKGESASKNAGYYNMVPLISLISSYFILITM